MKYRGNILVAPLNWGLGHATRCVPIIKLLLKYNFNPIIASDGAALLLLKKEFPELTFLELPSYNIRYAKRKHLLKVKMLVDSPRILKAIKTERKTVKEIVKQHDIIGIISDNRPGVYHKNIWSVFITHQLKVLSGNTTWLTTAWHQKLMKRFDECWVPDYRGQGSLAGKLAEEPIRGMIVKYIGILSRFDRIIGEQAIDIILLLSGPEPYRTYLEEKLLKEFANTDKNIVMVRGVIEDEIKSDFTSNITIYNYLSSETLEDMLNSSKIVVSRSGYTSIMDFARLNKKAFFIPTPGQFEQEYLAKHLSDIGMAPYCKQDDFKAEKLEELKNFRGLEELDYQYNFKRLFGLFERK